MTLSGVIFPGLREEHANRGRYDSGAVSGDKFLYFFIFEIQGEKIMDN